MPDQAAFASVLPQRISAPPGGRTLLPRAVDLAADAGSLSVARGLGARLYGDAERSYLDLCMGHGALLLGHGAASVKDALARQLEAGWLFGFAHDTAERLAALIHKAGPANERVMLCNSESDATLLAMRAARAHTGRDLVAVFGGASHGLHDAALVTAHMGTSAAPRPAANDQGPSAKARAGAGVAAGAAESVVVLPYGTDAALAIIHAHRDRLAGVMVEAVPTARPSLAHGPWLKRLAAACREDAVPLILDETYTGFRVRYGGAQEFFDITPDLVTYGGALGGGLPIGAVAGRAGIMSVFGGGKPEQRIFCGTTHAGNPLSAAAAEAVLSVLSTHRDTVYPQLHKAASNLGTTFNRTAETMGVAARIDAAGSMFRVFFGCEVGDEPGPRRPAEEARHMERVFYRELLNRGVVVHAAKRCFLSTAHTLADIGEISAAFIAGLKAAAP
jgi:glutamate-1-semialdehyde aminotransferase